MQQEKILILDFGSQFTQLIARKVRELSVYSEILPFSEFHTIFDIDSVKGVILSGSPFSVYQENAPKVDIKKIIDTFPTLGICYGAQHMVASLGGIVSESAHREYGKSILKLASDTSPLFYSLPKEQQVWMSHSDTITSLPENSKLSASTQNIKNAAFQINNTVFGLQFHPEVYHSTLGKNILDNFLTRVCNCSKSWTEDFFIKKSIQEIQKKIKDEDVILGFSGGVDSTVTAKLIHESIGKQLHCIFIDNGLLRQNEFETVLADSKSLGINIHGFDASSVFLTNLKGITDPEEKRKIIGKTFIDVFASKAKLFKEAKWLAQGTIYPDVIESGSVHGPSSIIKSHHNVGGLPKDLSFKLLEPMRLLFKDEVRNIGKALGIRNELLEKHPFPGPGLSIRILGEITEEKLEVLRKADDIYMKKLKKTGIYKDIWQAGCILLPHNSVGVMGDGRTYEKTVALRAVNSVDGMTADWSRIPYDILAEISNEIVNGVKGINRVVYDISSKPPSTIEWE